MNQITICLIIFFVSLICYATRIVPMGVTALVSMLLFIFTGCLDAPTAMATISNSNAIIMVCMVIIATAFSRTTFVDTICNAIMKVFGGDFRKAYLCFLLLGVLLGNLGNGALACFSIVYPLLLNVCRKCQVSPAKAMFGLLLVCVSCLTSLPLATALNMSARMNGFLSTYEFTQIMTPMTFFKGRFPIMLLTIAYAWIIVPKLAPKTSEAKELEDTKRETQRRQLSRFSNLAGIVIFAANIVLMLCASKLGVEPYLICFSCAMLMIVCGVLTENEAIKAMPISMVALYVGANAAGAALTATGAGNIVGSWMAGLLGGTHSSYLIGFMFFAVPFTLTQFMNNGGVLNVFLPICLLTCQALGANPIGPLILVDCACTTAFLTPMATPSVPLCMGVGGYEMKHLFKMGLPLAVLLTAANVLYVMTVYPCF